MSADQDIRRSTHSADWELLKAKRRAPATGINRDVPEATKDVPGQSTMVVGAGSSGGRANGHPSPAWQQSAPTDPGPHLDHARRHDPRAVIQAALIPPWHRDQAGAIDAGHEVREWTAGRALACYSD